VCVCVGEIEEEEDVNKWTSVCAYIHTHTHTHTPTSLLGDHVCFLSERFLLLEPEKMLLLPSAFSAQRV
jgi:hypothetical protein